MEESISPEVFRIELQRLYEFYCARKGINPDKPTSHFDFETDSDLGDKTAQKILKTNLKKRHKVMKATTIERMLGSLQRNGFLSEDDRAIFKERLIIGRIAQTSRAPISTQPPNPPVSPATHDAVRELIRWSRSRFHEMNSELQSIKGDVWDVLERRLAGEEIAVSDHFADNRHGWSYANPELSSHPLDVGHGRLHVTEAGTIIPCRFPMLSSFSVEVRFGPTSAPLGVQGSMLFDRAALAAMTDPTFVPEPESQPGLQHILGVTPEAETFYWESRQNQFRWDGMMSRWRTQTYIPWYPRGQKLDYISRSGVNRLVITRAGGQASFFVNNMSLGTHMLRGGPDFCFGIFCEIDRDGILNGGPKADYCCTSEEGQPRSMPVNQLVMEVRVRLRGATTLSPFLPPSDPARRFFGEELVES